MGMPAAPPDPSVVPPPYGPADAPPGTVPNPAYRALYQSYSAAYGSIDTVRDAITAATKTFNSTDAWLGPEARAWGEGLTSGRRDLRNAADTILWGIYERLMSTQRTLTTS